LPGATSHEAEAVPPAPADASHVPPSQPALAYDHPETWMLKRFFRSLTQAFASDALMKLPSQKMAVWAMHPPVHFACSDAVQLALPMAWHETSHERFA